VRVLFLALGNYRRRAVIDEATSVLAGGGSATVILSDIGQWEVETFPEGLDVLDITHMERDHLPLRLERKIVFGLPRRILKLTGRGRLRRPSRRVWKYYKRRFAKPVHRRAMERYNHIYRDRRHALTMSRVTATPYDYINVTDYLSIPVAARVMSDLDASPQKAAPQVIFGIDYLS
jgi:hypothetical protein